MLLALFFSCHEINLYHKRLLVLEKEEFKYAINYVCQVKNKLE